MNAQDTLKNRIKALNLDDEFKAKMRDPESEFEIDTYKQELKNKLLKDNEAKTFSEQNIDQTVNDYFSNLNSFQLPENTKGMSWAKAYVNRKKIGLAYGIPILSGALLITTTLGIVNAKEKAELNKFERSTEALIEQSYTQKKSLETEIQTLNSTVPAKYLDKNELEGFRNIALGDLEITETFFAEYCPNGIADDKVTKENMKFVREEWNQINENIDLAKENVEQGKTLILTGKELLNTRMNLDAIIGTIRAIEETPKVYENKSERIYKAGVVSVESRNLSEGKNALSQLNTIKTNIGDFVDITTEYESLKSNINAVIIEQAAANQANTLYRDMKSDMQSTDVNGMKDNMQELNFLYAIVKTDGKLQIVQRSGEKSGEDRVKGSARKCYLIIELVDKNTGAVIPQRIHNQENGKTEIVKTYGWEIPSQTFERVKQDKIDDRIIQDNIVGFKKIGYVTPTITFKDTRGRKLPYKGFITRW